MGTRLGIELSPTACRIVEVEAGPGKHAPGDIRVRSFAVLPPSGPEFQTKLESLRRRQAAVVVWGGRSEHRQVMVTAGPYESMRAEAMASLAAAGLTTAAAWVDITPAWAPGDLTARRPVVAAIASASELADLVQPFRDAGIRLRTVTTPAMALASLARARQAFSVPGVIESYVALDEKVTCLALVRNGVLLAARDLPWGFIESDYARTELRTHEEVATRLADTIGEFVAEVGGSPGDIGQVCICGGLPGLRTMAAALMDRLDVEVEPLDSLFGIDVARLPEPAEEFRERGAELRLAWAAATDWPAPINLLRARRRTVSRIWLTRAAVLAGVAVGLGASYWVVVRSQSGPPRIALAGVAPAPTPAVKKPVLSPATVVTKAPVTAPAAAPPAVGPVLPGPVAGPPVTAPKGPAPQTGPPPPFVPPPPVVAAPVAAPPAVVAAKPPTVVPPPPAIVAPPPAAVDRPARVAERPAVVERPAERIAPPPAPVVVDAPVARRRPAPPAETALPFDAELGTILYSADRKLAIIDNRIVGIGDEVRGARVVEISAAEVMLRDGQGRLRRLPLGSGGR